MGALVFLSSSIQKDYLKYKFSIIIMKVGIHNTPYDLSYLKNDFLMIQLPLRIYLDNFSTLDNFFVGHNAELIDQLMQLPKQTKQMFYIWGASQSGKTHLAQAICHYLAQSYANKTSVYLPLNNSHLTPKVLEGLSSIDFIFLDAIEIFEKEHEWSIALFNLFNEIKETETCLIIFSDKAPRQLSFQLKDLISRLSSMTTYKLNKVEQSFQGLFLQEQAIKMGMDINSDVIQFILNRTQRNLAHLIKIFKILNKQSLAHQRKVTIPFVKQILKI
jgi:DnaA family protein